MEGKLLTFLLVLCAAYNAAALSCYVCRRNGLCDAGEIGQPQTCTPDNSDYGTNQCVKFNGSYTGDATTQEQPYSTYIHRGVVRSCIYFQRNVDAPPLQCFSGSDAAPYISDVFMELFGGDTNARKVTGDLCFCASNGCNGVDSLKPFLWLILTVFLMHLLLR